MHPAQLMQEASASTANAIGVLLVEDDERLARLTSRYLKAHGCHVFTARSVAEGQYALQRESFELVLLDLMLPDGDGLTLCREIRTGSTVPVIIVTARGQAWDCVHGLDLGADDYITKPFAPHELLARIHARVRRLRGQVGPGAGRLELGELRLSRAQQQAWLGSTPLPLTACEFHLLWTLALRAGSALRRDQLVHGIDISERTVDVHVSRIRTKMNRASTSSAPPRIRAVRGVGYLLAHEAES